MKVIKMSTFEIMVVTFRLFDAKGVDVIEGSVVEYRSDSDSVAKKPAGRRKWASF